MERVHLLDRNVDLFFEKEQSQCYLDAYLHSPIREVPEDAVVFKREGQIKL